MSATTTTTADTRPKPWTPAAEQTACCQFISNVNPAGDGERLLVPCPRSVSNTCPTCGHGYCAEHWRWHWQRDKARPGSHGWCAARPRPKSALPAKGAK